MNKKGFLSITAWGGYELNINDSGDRAVPVMVNGEKRTRLRERLVHFNNNGDPYVTIYGKRYYLKEFMAV